MQQEDRKIYCCGNFKNSKEQELIVKEGNVYFLRFKYGSQGLGSNGASELRIPIGFCPWCASSTSTLSL